MKIRYVIFLILPLFFLPGCKRKRVYEPVPEGNVSVGFRLDDGEGNDIFSGEIGDVHLFVFDGDDRFVTRSLFDSYSLSRLQGGRLTLERGDYRIVCWGNVQSNSVFSTVDEHSLFGDCRLLHLKNELGEAETGDPYYYGVLEVTVQSEPVVRTLPSPVSTREVDEFTLDFSSAHKGLEVYLLGFSETASDPHVRITSVPAGYDFALNLLPGTMNYESAVVPVVIPEGDAWGVHFHTPYFDPARPVFIHVKNGPAGEDLFTLDLYDFLEREAEEGRSAVEEDRIVILIEFTDGEVSVVIPEWSKIPVEPEF